MATYKGKYKPKNPSKYRGDPTKVVYRSSWELKAMNIFDQNPNIIWWNSEETVIPYRCKTDGRLHRYFVDFTICMINSDGRKVIKLIEVKPFAQTQEPKQPSRKTKRYVNEVMTYAKNVSKWEAAQQWCADRKYEFVILTEKQLL